MTFSDFVHTGFSIATLLNLYPHLSSFFFHDFEIYRHSSVLFLLTVTYIYIYTLSLETHNYNLAAKNILLCAHVYYIRMIRRLKGDRLLK